MYDQVCWVYGNSHGVNIHYRLLLHPTKHSRWFWLIVTMRRMQAQGCPRPVCDCRSEGHTWKSYMQDALTSSCQSARLIHRTCSFRIHVQEPKPYSNATHAYANTQSRKVWPRHGLWGSTRNRPSYCLYVNMFPMPEIDSQCKAEKRHHDDHFDDAKLPATVRSPISGSFFLVMLGREHQIFFISCINYNVTMDGFIFSTC